MLIQSIFGKKSRHALVRDIYRSAIRSTREFMHICKERATEVSPNQKALLLKCFTLQDLLLDQRSIRLEYLLKTKAIDCAVFKSLDAIDELLDRGLKQQEEDALKKSNPNYSDICQEIVDIRSKWESVALTAPLKSIETDPQYRAARLAMSDRTRELQRRISPS
jgi:hypothetical protein